jgi:excisionase family DNA binding protein
MTEARQLGDDFISATEAAELIGKNSKTISRWIATGRLNATKVGRSFSISRSELASVARRPDLVHQGSQSENEPLRHPLARTGNSYRADPNWNNEALSQLLTELEEQLVEAASSAAKWQARSRILAARLEEAESMVRGLEVQLQRRVGSVPDRLPTAMPLHRNEQAP